MVMFCFGFFVSVCAYASPVQQRVQQSSLNCNELASKCAKAIINLQERIKSGQREIKAYVVAYASEIIDIDRQLAVADDAAKASLYTRQRMLLTMYRGKLETTHKKCIEAISELFEIENLLQVDLGAKKLADAMPKLTR
jgi:hypothetical protein